jgi:NAD(P)-dependent dehydrogenase (short-subunit alcohol dehydrogenase family)
MSVELSQAKHAFITGAASGIGLGIVDALLNHGVSVTIADIDADGVQTVVAQRRGRVRGQVFDVRDPLEWDNAKTEAEAAFGPVDILISNAGIGPDGEELADAKRQSFDLIMAVNVGGAFNAISAFGPDMRQRGRGHIALTASITGLVTGQVPRIGIYSASKFAVVALGESLRAEMVPHGVSVSIICPGMVASNLGRTSKRLGMAARKLEPGPGARVGAVPMSSAQAGELIIDGIANGDFYIVTHPAHWMDVEGRFQELRDAFSS